MSKPASICVYCGSSSRAVPKFGALAFQLGRELGARGIRLIYGGGGIGLMGRVADGCLEAGGQVTGIIPSHLHDKELAHRGVQELLVVETMHERKTLMEGRADAFIILPGGFGTLDEMFEILTWRQLGLHAKPIVLIDQEGYWAPLRAMIARMIEEHFVTEKQAEVLIAADGIESTLAALGIA